MSFKFDYAYHPQFFFEDNVNLCSKSFFVNKQVKELKKLIDIY